MKVRRMLRHAEMKAMAEASPFVKSLLESYAPLRHIERTGFVVKKRSESMAFDIEHDVVPSIGQRTVVKMRHVYDATNRTMTVICRCGSRYTYDPETGDVDELWAMDHAECQEEE